MQKVITCPECQNKLKLTVDRSQDVRVQCPRCQKKLLIRLVQPTEPRGAAAAGAASQQHDGEEFDQPEEMSDGLDFGGEFDEQDDSGLSPEQSEESDGRFDEQWDEFGNAIDRTKKKTTAVKEPESNGMPYIRTPLMDRDDYRNPDREIRNPVLRSLYAISAVCFANVYMGFGAIILATFLVIGLPLWGLYGQWKKDAGVEDGDEIRMLQTLGNVTTVVKGAREVYNGESGIKDDIEDIKTMNKQAEQARQLHPDGKID